MENRIGRLGDLILVLLALLTTRIVYWQLVRGDLLQPLNAVILAGAPWTGLPWIGTGVGDNPEDPQTEINRQVIAMLSNGGVPVDLSQLPQPLVQRTRDLLSGITRGTIYDRSGAPLAYDQDPGAGDGSRLYADPSLGHITGYTSGLRIGIAGLERAYNGTLFGLQRLDAQVGRMLRLPVRGSDLLLTLDLPLQEAAAAALNGKRGAVVILNSDGAVLAMVSSPGFDPSRMLDPAYTASLGGCEGQGCPAPLLNRATQARYVPGSTWKTVPLIAGLDTGQLRPGMVFDFGKALQGPDGPYYIYTVDGGVIPDPNHRENRLTLELSYAKSANAAFARIGDEMGATTLIDYAARLGFTPDAPIRYPFDLLTEPPQLANEQASLAENNLLRASTAIGQGELLVTPLSIARMVLPAVNDGALPHPYLIAAIRDPDGSSTPGPNAGLSTPVIRPETAREVRRMMQIVVEQGFGNRAAVRGLVVGGKTGTAQLGPGQAPHAWFAGYASDNRATVVMAVVIENAGEGSQAAAPVFAQLAPLAIAAASRAVQTPPLPTPEPTQPPAQPTPQPGVPPVQATPTAGGEQPPLQPTPPPGVQPQATPTVDVPVPIQPDIRYQEGQTPFYIKSGPSCQLRDAPLTGDGAFTWPTNYQALSGGAFREGHPGADFAAPDGSPVYAADDGIAVFAGWSGNLGYGNVVVIDHGNGFWTLYAHLSTVSVPCGTAVRQGQRIGMSGSTGNTSGDHLHFEVRVASGYVDPIRVLPTP